MPASFRPDDHIGIGADSDGIVVTIQLGDHLDIVKVGENQILATLKQFESETAPKIDQALLGVTIETPVAFYLAKLDSGAHHLERQARVAVFLANGQALDLGEIGEETEAQTARRLIADIAEQVRRRQIVTVELLLIRTFLLADIDGASQAGDAHEILERPRHSD